MAKYTRAYQIGLIDPSETLNGRSEQEKEKVQKELEIREDFRKIQQIALEKVILNQFKNYKFKKKKFYFFSNKGIF